MAFLSERVRLVVISKGFQYPKGKRLLVQIYLYNNRYRDDLYIYGIYDGLKELKSLARPKPVQDYMNRYRDDLYIYGIYDGLKELKSLARPKPVQDYMKWGLKHKFLDKHKSETVDGRNRQYYRINKYGVEFCEYHFGLLGLDFESSRE